MLQGVKVVDLTSVVFGPYCTQILADLGAEVTKIEPPELGDVFRWSGRSNGTPGMAPGFLSINGGKRSAALDLKHPEDMAAMMALLAEADVFIHNVRGQAITRLGLDYDSVRAINPGIIYAHCVGFGQDGPYADLQAYDDVIQAATGAASLASRVDGDPKARYIPSLVADKVAGLHGAYGVLAAIIHKLRSGEGQQIEVPMFEAFAQFMLVEHFGGMSFDPPNAPPCYFRQIDPDRQPFPTLDGHISIVAYTDSAWPRIFAVLEAPEVLDDPRFATPEARLAAIPELYRIMAGLTVKYTAADLAERLQAAQIPAQPVRDIGTMLDDPHLQATGFFTRREHDSEGSYFEMAQPVRFSAHAPQPRRLPPRLGQHSDEVRALVKPAKP